MDRDVYSARGCGEGATRRTTDRWGTPRGIFEGAHRRSHGAARRRSHTGLTSTSCLCIHLRRAIVALAKRPARAASQGTSRARQRSAPVKA